MNTMVRDGTTGTAMVVLYSKKLLRGRNGAIVERIYSCIRLKANSLEAFSLYASCI